MTAILGLSAYYHDSAAALVVDGRVVAAAQEERFTRRKHDAGYPRHAIDYCLAEAGLSRAQVDTVVFYEKPLLKFDRIVETFLATAPSGLGHFVRGVPLWGRKRLRIASELRREMGEPWDGTLLFTEHHRSHAASAFYPSPFDEAAVLTVDGVGEWATTTVGRGSGRELEILDEIHFPHSLGLLYSAFTYFCGFRVNSGEYKLMGLAPYGEPRYADLIRDHLVEVGEDGAFRLNMASFHYTRGATMTAGAFEKLFGGPARRPESPLTQREMDLAASVQLVTEEIMLGLARRARERTGSRNLCLAGGVALNCVANGKILRAGIFDRMFIQPAAGDAGGALGAALEVWHRFHEGPRDAPSPRDAMRGALLGPSYSDEQVALAVAPFGARSTLHDDDALPRVVADLIASGKVVGWFWGRMEFGPRALGSRSILGDARSTEMQRVMNLKIKFRESFRPFAPSVLAEHASEWFEIDRGVESPYMLLVADVQKERRIAVAGGAGRTGVDRVNEVRSTIPAVTHVDYSARLQTVDAERHGMYHRVLEAFHEKTGCPVVINTSFNIRGEPIVCRPEEAYRCFMFTDMDALVLGRHVFLKSDQPELPGASAYKAQFKLD